MERTQYILSILKAIILEKLEMPAIHDFTVIAETEMAMLLQGRPGFVLLKSNGVNQGIPEDIWIIVYLLLGKYDLCHVGIVSQKVIRIHIHR